MKRVMHALCAGVFALFALVSCSKSVDNGGYNNGNNQNNNGSTNGNNSKSLNIPVEAKAIIPEETLHQIRAQGMPIYEGTNPPNIEGIYLLDNLRFHYSSDPGEKGFTKGDKAVNYKYRFYQQNGVKLKSDYRALKFGVNDIATGSGAIISGSGNNFTVFLNHAAHTEGVKNNDIILISGEITPEGIKDLLLTLTVTEKEDTNNQIMKVGVYRIFQHEGIARRETLY
ncbi:hypothetical protein CAPGI0001_0754 [Capnocytophaga gingivalis ATCC 33624]|jgi:hypothetical protein|uniref:hypothetical protein n=1 Tax=Capnocytophaga gingivalis TaxID=1017 RepID=UPI00019FBDA1|nr:hypothetical protein [Capnocytophaga gingivalis]EEK15522.1 hypothetical protein CAPGI0001_0754 [Capnocytophaga gingivalis ATCC 33624]